MKKIPMRSCVFTKEKLPKNELIRIVKVENDFIVDETGKVNGHGAYLKKDISVIEDAKKKKILNKVFETEVSESVYDEIINKIK